MNTLLYEIWGEYEIDGLAQTRGIYPPTFITNPDKNPFVTELFCTKDTADTRLSTLQSQWRSVFLRKIPAFKSGLHYLAQWSNGQVRQLKYLYPEVETELSTLSDDTTQYALYILRTDMGEFYDTCPEFLEFLNKQGSQKI